MATFTVSASMTSVNYSMGLKVIVLTGATEAGGASAGNTASPPDATLTPNGSNSYLAFGVFNETNSTSWTAAANNTLLDNVTTGGSTQTGDGHYSGTVTALTGVTVGCSAPTGNNTTVAIYEILASGGTTPVADASTPAIVTGTSSPVTTASFTPPAGAVLVAIVTGSPSSASNPGITDTSGLSLTWTPRKQSQNTGTASSVSIFTTTIPGGGPATGPVFRPAVQAIRAKWLSALPRGVYMGASVMDTSFGTGQIQWNSGAPVRNPGPGPVLHQRTSQRRPRGAMYLPRAGGVYMGTGPKDTSFGTGQVQWSAGAPLQNPQPGPVFHQATQPIRARVPQNIAGGIFGSATAGGDASYGSGHCMWSPGAPVNNPQPGPVFIQRKTPVRFIIPPPPPRKGRIGSSFGAAVQNPAHGPPAYPPQGPVRARLPQLQPRAGRVTSSPGAPLQNPQPGPVFRQKTYPVQAAGPLPRRGRVYVTAKPFIAAPPSPAPFYPAVQALRARLPQQPLLRGRIYSSPGTPVRNPQPGPVFTQKTSPVKACTPPPALGRVYATFKPPVAVIPPPAGPAFYPAVQAIRAKLPLQPLLRGRSASNPGAPVQNPAPGPPFYPPCCPVHHRHGPFICHPWPGGILVSGGTGSTATRRIFWNATPVTAVIVPAAPFPPLRAPVRARLPLPRRGTCRTIRFFPVQANPAPGPAVHPLQHPVRAQFPLPPRGRINSNPGGPVQNPVPGNAGPPFRQATSPTRIRITLPPRGRTYGNPGTPARNPHQGAAFPAPHGPVQARIPQVFSKGRATSNPGASPPAAAPAYPQHGPARARITPPPRGRIAASPGIPVAAVLVPAPVYPLHGPVRIRPALPPRGRTGSNPGTPVPLPPVPAPVYPLHGPVAARRPLPPHGRVITGNPGAPVRNPHPGPAVYPLHGPVGLANRAPGPFLKGRATGNPGGPVQNPVPPPPYVYPAYWAVQWAQAGSRVTVSPAGPLAATQSATVLGEGYGTLYPPDTEVIYPSP